MFADQREQPVAACTYLRLYEECATCWKLATQALKFSAHLLSMLYCCVCCDCIHKQMYVRILHKVMLVRQIRMYALLFTK